MPGAVLLRPGHVVAEGAGVARPEGVLPLHVDLDLAEGALEAALQARHLVGAIQSWGQIPTSPLAR